MELSWFYDRLAYLLDVAIAAFAPPDVPRLPLDLKVWEVVVRTSHDGTVAPPDGDGWWLVQVTTFAVFDDGGGQYEPGIRHGEQAMWARRRQPKEPG